MRDMFENISNISKDDEDEEKPFDLLNRNVHTFLWIWKYKRMRRILSILALDFYILIFKKFFYTRFYTHTCGDIRTFI